MSDVLLAQPTHLFGISFTLCNRLAIQRRPFRINQGPISPRIGPNQVHVTVKAPLILLPVPFEQNQLNVLDPVAQKRDGADICFQKDLEIAAAAAGVGDDPGVDPVQETLVVARDDRVLFSVQRLQDARFRKHA